MPREAWREPDGRHGRRPETPAATMDGSAGDGGERGGNAPMREPPATEGSDRQRPWTRRRRGGGRGAAEAGSQTTAGGPLIRPLWWAGAGRDGASRDAQPRTDARAGGPLLAGAEPLIGGERRVKQTRSGATLAVQRGPAYTVRVRRSDPTTARAARSRPGH
jgi:hypothetical protein